MVTSNTLTALTSASFTPPANSLIVVMVGSDGAAAGTATTMAVTDTGGGLTWAEKAKANSTTSTYAGVWIAQVPAGSAVAGSKELYANQAIRRASIW